MVWMRVEALTVHLEIVSFSFVLNAGTFLVVFLALGIEVLGSTSLTGPATRVSLGAVAGLGDGYGKAVGEALTTRYRRTTCFQPSPRLLFRRRSSTGYLRHGRTTGCFFWWATYCPCSFRKGRLRLVLTAAPAVSRVIAPAGAAFQILPGG